MADHIQIGDVSPRIQYTADGSETTFIFPFPVFDEADIRVYEGAALKTVVTDYTVSGVGESSGGTVTFSLPPAINAIITLHRSLVIRRTTDFQEAGEFRAKVINDELDKIIAIAQQLEDLTDRSLQLSETDVAESLTLPNKVTRQEKLLGFDANGSPVASMLSISDMESGATDAALSAAAALASKNDAAASATQTAADVVASQAHAAAAAIAAAANLYATISNKTSDFTITASDNGTLFCVDTSGGNVEVAMPDITAEVPEGFRIGIVKCAVANVIDVIRSGTDTINGGASYVLTADTEFVTFIANDTTPDNWVTFGASTTSAGPGLVKSGSTISLKPIVVAAIALGDETTALEAANEVVTFHAPVAFTLTTVVAGLTVAQASGDILTFDIKKSDSSILSTKLTIDNTEETSVLAVTPVVVSDTAIGAGAKLSIDIDQIGDGTAIGAKIYLVGYPA